MYCEAGALSSPRTIKETLNPLTFYGYPFMEVSED